MLTVVDSHHKVLSSWAEYRCSLEKAPRLITLDHHTDTSAPFRNFIKKTQPNVRTGSDEFFKIQNELLGEINFKKSESINVAIQKLNNDEHIVAAIKTDIISSALVIAHNAANTDLKTYLEHNIICRTVNERLNKNRVLKPDHNSVLESDLLNKRISEFDSILKETNESPLFDSTYILDIDLDYLNTFKSVEPNNSSVFKKLIVGAGLITVATEPDYVKSCALDKNLTSDYLLKEITQYIINT